MTTRERYCRGFLTKCAQVGVNPGRLIKFARRGYTIRQGDNLSTIARANGIPLSELLAYNPAIKNPDKIRVGQSIYLDPDDSKLVDWNPETQHKVVAGDTGHGIANAYGLKFNQLAKMNPHVNDWKKLQIGTIINR